MASDGSSSSSSKSSSLLSVNEKDLLKFYKKKYEEFQRKEDKYKEKVDRHLKNLVTDRGELEEEVLRRGEKIADLQKAVVELQLCVFQERERFLQVSSENTELKRNEGKLHDSIRQLLAMTDQQDLRDKIIYILKKPEVEIGYRTDFSAKSRPAPEITVNQKLKEEAKSQSLQDLEQLVDIYKRTAQDSKKFGLSTEGLTNRIKTAEKVLQEENLKKCDDNLDEMIMKADPFEADPSPSAHEEILRNINKTLSKVELLEKGRYWKDEEMCRKLVENINALTDQFKELNEEFNVKYVQDHFSEYSKVTLSKLEELAKQCRNSVIAAEAQIAAHRSNAKHLSERLKETEELLRESIHECLSLKQKNKQTEAEYEMEKFTLISSLKEKLEQNTSQGVDNVIDELISNFPVYETIKSTPYICMYCRHGPGHKHCEEKIKELAAECRKFKTQLKLLKQETDQERLTLKNHREVAESSVTDLTKANQNMKNALQALEKRNASLLEQVKLERNRLKNMERFRRLEIEGFQTDIKQLKDKIKELEKQLLKAVLIFENNHKDIELLKTVHETAHRSEQATAMLKRLKSKLYQLENDIKSL